MKHAIFNQKSHAADVQSADAEECGMPRQGTHAYQSGYRPDLVSPTPGRGWCLVPFTTKDHPKNKNKFAYPIKEERSNALKNRCPARAAEIDARDELTPDWFEEPDPPSVPNGQSNSRKIRQ